MSYQHSLHSHSRVRNPFLDYIREVYYPQLPKPNPSLHSFYTISNATPHEVRPETQPPTPGLPLPPPDMNSTSVLGTIWGNLKAVMSNIFAGCCSGQNEEFPVTMSARSSIRGLSKGAPRYYGARDRGTITEVESWLGGIPSSLRSTWSRSGAGSNFTFM